MGYLSLYRKWRPKTFDDLAGQKTVVKTLKNALKNNRIAHAYLFCGPRGTGKTSTAKVFAKSLNCEEGPTPNPCNECLSCEQINSGRSVDVIEIDAASNRGIDEIRDLREKVKFSPREGDYKVYIIDEVHMLTKVAFNALLKTLEEPPPNVVFILATTEPHKVIPTILSRCQRFDFGLLAIKDLISRLNYICDQEDIAAGQSALNLIARTAEGGMRDAISILDQAIAYSGEKLDAEDVNTILGKVDQRVMSKVVEVISNHDSRQLLELINQIVDNGKDINQFIKDLIFHFRDLMLIKECGTHNTLIDLPGELKNELVEQARNYDLRDLLRIMEILSEADQELKLTSQPRLVLEMNMIKLSSPNVDTSISNLINRLSKLEDMVQDGKLKVESSPEVEESKDKPKGKEGAKSNFDLKREQIKKVSEGKRENQDHNKKDSVEKKSQQSVAEEKGRKKEEPSKVDNNPSETESKSTENKMEPETVQNIDISLEEMKKYWKVTMDLLNKYSQTRKLRAFALKATPYKIVNDIIYIAFPQGSTFHKEHAEKEVNVLEKALKKVTGQSVKVKCIFEGDAIEEGSSDSTSKKNSKTESKQVDIKEDPVVQRVVQVFDGKIIGVEDVEEV